MAGFMSDPFAAQRAKVEAEARRKKGEQDSVQFQQSQANVQTPQQTVQTQTSTPNIYQYPGSQDAPSSPIRQDAYEGLLANQQNYGLQAESEQRRMSTVQPYLDQFQRSMVASQSGSGGSSSPAQVDLAGIHGLEDASQTAIFNRAKETAGNIGRSAVDSLSDLMGYRGMVGSGQHDARFAGVVGEGARQLGDVNREQAIQAFQNARQRASEAYQGGITQRGQDISLRGQDMAQQQSQQALYNQSINALLGLVY